MGYIDINGKTPRPSSIAELRGALKKVVKDDIKHEPQGNMEYIDVKDGVQRPPSYIEVREASRKLPSGTGHAEVDIGNLEYIDVKDGNAGAPLVVDPNLSQVHLNIFYLIMPFLYCFISRVLSNRLIS